MEDPVTLFSCITNSDIGTLRVLLSQGHDPNEIKFQSIGEEVTTPLVEAFITAIENDSIQLEMIVALVEAGADFKLSLGSSTVFECISEHFYTYRAPEYLHGVLETTYRLWTKRVTSVTNGYTTNLLASIYDNANCTDVTLVCKDGEIQAHRVILSAASQYFAAIFEGPWKENHEQRVHIDHSKEVMMSLMQYMYTGTLDTRMLVSEPQEIIAASSLFLLSELTREYELQLASQLTLDTLARLLFLAVHYNLPDLKAKCIRFVDYNALEVLLRKDIVALSFENPRVHQELIDALSEPDSGERTGEESSRDS